MKYIQCLMLLPVLVAFQNCDPAKHNTHYLDDLALPQLKPEAGNFSGCSEIVERTASRKALYQLLLNEYVNSHRGTYASSNSGMASDVSSAPTITNIQEAGVDEPDILKADTQSLYIARSSTVEIVNKTTFAVTQTVDSGVFNPKLLLDNGKLIVLGHGSSSYRVRIFAKDGAGRFQLETEHKFPGRIVNARLTAGRVIVVLSNDSGMALAPVDGTIAGVPCSDVQRPVVDDFNYSLTAVHQIPLDGSGVKSTAVPGMANYIYATPKHLYVMANGYSWLYWDPRASGDLLWQSQIISQVDISGAQPSFSAAGVVLGYIRNEWAVKEIDDRFYIATTYNHGTRVNRLWTLRQGQGHLLRNAGMSEEFGPREDIRAVRYVDEKAYIVTFEKTDPLFAFDLASGDTPRMLSRLEIPGFSAYLHPLGNSLMLGVGYDAVPEKGFSWLAGLQLSLFDFQNPSNVRVLDQQVFGGRYSHAEVTGDHHAFYYGDGLVALPVNILKAGDPSNPWISSYQLEFSGAMFLTFDSQIHVQGKVSHYEWIPPQCRNALNYGAWWSSVSPSFDVRRVTKVGNLLVSMSPFGLKASDPANGFTTVRSATFSNNDAECTRQANNHYYW